MQSLQTPPLAQDDLARRLATLKARLQNKRANPCDTAKVISYNSTVSEDGTRWVENPCKGLRWVGWADKLAGRAVDHRGWYTDSDFQSEVWRGCVFRLPHGRLVPGYARHEGRSDDFAPIDGGARLAFQDMAKVDFSDEKSAAIIADSLARIAAEHDREYNDAWEAGQVARAALDEAKELKAKLYAALKERRKVRSALGSDSQLCRLLVEKAKEMLEEIGSLKAKAQGLVGNHTNWGGLNEAFADGFGEG